MSSHQTLRVSGVPCNSMLHRKASNPAASPSNPESVRRDCFAPSTKSSGKSSGGTADGAWFVRRVFALLCFVLVVIVFMRGQRKLSMRMAGHKSASKTSSKSRNGLTSYYEQILARLFNRFGRCKNHQKLLILGLDGAGKTTLLRKVKVLEPRPQPTVGFNLESLQYRQVTLIMWDVGGQEKIRALWHHYFVKSHGLIFVVDSSDPGRIPEARKELQKLLHEPELKDAKLLVYANKQDVRDCLSVADLTDLLDLSLVQDRDWYVQECSACTGRGVYEGLDWLVESLKPS